MNAIGLKELAFVGYPVTDFAKARRFYGEILGLKETITFDHEGALGWVEYDLAGQTLALASASEQWGPNSNGGGACLELHDLDAAVAYLKSKDVKIVMDIQDFPFCRMALIADPDGNTLALHQRKANHPEGSHSFP
jgi:predicted enzyme related to lactoylglutathione lyase